MVKKYIKRAWRWFKRKNKSQRWYIIIFLLIHLINIILVAGVFIYMIRVLGE